MRLHRFYISDLVGNRSEVRIDAPALASQMRNVFRLRTGDEVIVFDGSGFDYRCAIAMLDKYGATLDVRETVESRYMPAREIALYAAVVKKDNFEWIVEKATELGTTKIIPILAERSEKKSLNEERLKKIAIEASEQSGRGTVPEIAPILDIESAIKLAQEMSVKGAEKNANTIVFHTEGAAFDATEIANDGAAIAIFIGPEGGWSPEEMDMFHANEFTVRSLGKQVLRAETATIAALSQVVFKS